MDYQEPEAILIAAIQKLVGMTVKLVRLGAGDLLPSRACSGFLIDRGDPLVTLFTARHSFDELGIWHLELDVAPEKQSILIPLPEPKRQVISPLLDVAWWDLSLHGARAQAAADENLGGTLPRMPILPNAVTPPTADERRYAFAGYNRMESYPPIPRLGGVRGLERSPAYELAMEFVGANADGLYRFKLIRAHQGDAYYAGASGAPILDEAGRLVSLVVSGCEKEDLIYGFPLATYLAPLGLNVRPRA